MSLTIPKDLRAAAFGELTLVLLNDVDVDRMLPHIFELTVKLGRTATSKTNPRDYELYLERLATESPRVQGFADEQGRRFLDGWLRTSIVDFGRAGRQRRFEQMDHVRPLTIACYRAGLPKSRSRHRQADELIYQLLVEGIRRRQLAAGEGDEHLPTWHVSELIKRSFGQGIAFTPQPGWAPVCDDPTDMDITALLAVSFLEGFEPVPGLSKDRPERRSVVPAATDALGDDLLDYLTAYGHVLPAQVLTSHLSALISLRLMQLPLRLAGALQHVLTTSTLHPDMTDGSADNPLQLYCDFTRNRASFSDELSRAAVQRDLDTMRGLFPHILRLRVTRDAVKYLKEPERDAALLREPHDVLRLLELRDAPRVELHAQMRLEEIREATAAGDGTDDDLAYLDDITSSLLPEVEQLTTVLVEALRRRGVENIVKWFHSTGAITKPYGILDGTLSARSTWRYAPSDELLTAMLLVIFTEVDGRRVRPNMPIETVLTRLRARFGVLIDVPPADQQGADARAAASANLEAFKRRLQLLGCFDSLSDDFSAQLVRRPLTEVL